VARRKRKDGEEAGWEPPEFDEIDFMRREMEGGRAAVVVIAWAVVGALFAFGLFASGLHPGIAFLAGLFWSVLLNYLFPLLGVRSAKFQRRDWAGHGVTYFFSWLAFWILLLNAPFTDFTSPAVHTVMVGSFVAPANLTAGTITCVPLTGGSANIDSNNSLYIAFKATDNFAVSRVRVQIGLDTWDPLASVAGDNNPCTSDVADRYPADTYVVTLPITASSFDVSVEAWDGGNRRASLAFRVNVNP